MSSREKGRSIKSNRSDGRFVGTLEFTHYLVKNLRPMLAFNPDMSAEDFFRWRGRVRRKLRDLMKFPKIPEQPAPRRLWSDKRDGYELQKWEIYPEPGCVVPFLMLIPNGITRSNPGPAALCFPGWYSTKELLAGEPELDGTRGTIWKAVSSQMARWYAKEGIISVAVDTPGMGQSKYRPDKDREVAHEDRIVACEHLMWMGRNYEGTSVFQKMKILEWLKKRDFVDKRRIAVSGHSLGAKPALILGLLDPTIKAVIFNSAAYNWQERAIVTNLHTSTLPRYLPGQLVQYVPGFMEWFDYGDLMAALAPTFFLISEGGQTKEINRIRKAFRLIGAADRIQVSYFPKYATSSKRKYDRKKIPDGVDMKTYHKYINVDAPMHCFKDNIAVPWLRKVL